MKELKINDKISYIPACDAPLSADIGIVRTHGTTWLYDVGCPGAALPPLSSDCRVVLSHFHPDHTGNLQNVNASIVYLSKETFNHVHRGSIVSDDVVTGGLRIFRIPSSHAKGCIGLEVDGEYAFVGDALYSRFKDGCYVYNATLLQDEISMLKALKAEVLLVSHFPGLVRPKSEVIAELEQIYLERKNGEPEIRIKREEK